MLPRVWGLCWAVVTAQTWLSPLLSPSSSIHPCRAWWWQCPGEPQRMRAFEIQGLRGK